jgi:hypothetical protein
MRPGANAGDDGGIRGEEKCTRCQGDVEAPYRTDCFQRAVIGVPPSALKGARATQYLPAGSAARLGNYGNYGSHSTGQFPAVIDGGLRQLAGASLVPPNLELTNLEVTSYIYYRYG